MGRNWLLNSANKAGTPSPFSAEMATPRGCCSKRRVNSSPFPLSLSVLLKAISVGLPSAPISFRTELFPRLRMAGIDDMNKHVCLHNFFERGFERLDQAMRELADETDRISEE